MNRCRRAAACAAFAKRLAGALGACGLLAALLAALLQAAHAADAWPGEIRIGVQKGDGLVALRASGRLEKALAPHHVTVKWIEFVYGLPMVEGINSGDVDVGTVGSTPPIFAQAGGAPSLVYVAYAPKLQRSYAIVVPKDSTVRDVRALRGKRIAVAKGSQGHLFVLKALQDAGLDAGAVQLAYLAYGEARAAFERGDVDAWAVPDPRYADAELGAGARALLEIGKLSVPQYGFYIATRRFAASYPAALRLLFEQVEAQARDSAAHPAATAALLADNTKVPLAVWQKAVPRVDWGARYPLDAAVLDAQQDSAELALRHKLIPRRVSIRDAVVDIR